MSTCIRSILVPAVLALAAGNAAAQKFPVVAMVTDVQGPVSIVRGGIALAPTVAAELSAAMRIEVREGGRLVLLELASGDELQLSGPATAEVRGTAIEADPKGKLTRKTTRVGPVKVREGGLAQAAVVLRATQQIQRLPLLSLTNTATMEISPAFRWAPVDGVGPYRFELADDKGKVLHEARTEATQMVLPDSVSLAEGKAYTWEVSARRSDGVRFSSFGDFTIATKDLRDRARELRPQASAGMSEWAAYALWLDGQSLADEARGVWRQLAKDRPDDPMLKALAGS